MDEATARAIQCEAADALLNRGISIPLKEFKMPFRKRPVVLRVTLKRPYMSGQIDFARTYLSMGVTAEKMALSATVWSIVTRLVPYIVL